MSWDISWRLEGETERWRAVGDELSWTVPTSMHVSSNREGSVSKRWTTCCWHHKSGWWCRPHRRRDSNRLSDIL